jgi:hypothetical protein
MIRWFLSPQILLSASGVTSGTLGPSPLRLGTCPRIGATPHQTQFPSGLLLRVGETREAAAERSGPCTLGPAARACLRVFLRRAVAMFRRTGDDRWPSTCLRSAHPLRKENQRYPPASDQTQAISSAGWSTSHDGRAQFDCALPIVQFDAERKDVMPQERFVVIRETTEVVLPTSGTPVTFRREGAAVRVDPRLHAGSRDVERFYADDG